MKLILDLDEETHNNLQGYAAQNNLSVNDVVADLFNKYVQDPASVIDEVHAKNGDLRELIAFKKVLMTYINEAIYDIQQSSESEEAFITDEDMMEVFKVLNRDIVNEPYVLTTLFKEYKKRRS